jgi:hypothetical protein
MHLYPHQSHGWDPVAWLIQALTRLRTGLMRHIDAPLTVQHCLVLPDNVTTLIHKSR